MLQWLYSMKITGNLNQPDFNFHFDIPTLIQFFSPCSINLTK